MELPVFHDHYQLVRVGQQFEIFQRIAVDQQQVGQETGLDLSQVVRLRLKLELIRVSVFSFWIKDRSGQ